MTGPRWMIRAAEILWDGSATMLRRWTDRTAGWCRRAKTPAGRAVRAALALLLAWLAVRAASRFARGHPWRIAFLTAWWCWAAWRAWRSGPRTPISSAAAEPEREVLDEASPTVSPEEFLRLVRQAIGDARGVHLITLVERLTETHPGRPWDTSDVRSLAAAAEVPVRPVVRAPGRGPTVGIHRDDLPPLPDPAPIDPQGSDVAVVVAGQEATTTPTTPAPTTPTTPEVAGGEEWFEVIDDPANDRRALVKWS